MISPWGHLHVVLLLGYLFVVQLPTKSDAKALNETEVSSGHRSARSIQWLHHLEDSVLTIPTQNGVLRRFYLGHGNGSPLRGGGCTTPYGQLGHCTHLRSCAHPEFLVSLKAVALHLCLLGDGHYGVCCFDYGEGIPSLSDHHHHHFHNPKPSDYTHQSHDLGSFHQHVINSNLHPVTTKRPLVTSTVGSGQILEGTCGVHYKEETRIVGGKTADPGEWPWMAALLSDGDQYCGGALISNRHVLTAAHCVVGRKENEITVRLGEYDFSKTSNTRTDFSVEKILKHENYDTKVYLNDIAVIKIKQHAKFNANIQPICLPPDNLVVDDQVAHVTGWGTTSFGGASSKVLREVNLPIWKNSECTSALKGRTFTSNQICAGYRQGKKDSCQGDSGGPLMFEKSTGKWAVVGVVSWGLKCALPNQPGVYTRVSSYLPWIKDKMLR